MAFEIDNLIQNYKLFVTKNPLLANEIEVGLKWISYIIAGRFSRSPVVTELIHSASKLLNLINDSILKKAAGIPIGENIIAEKLQIFLTVIEHIEVFTEVSSYRIAGSKGKWLIVVIVEIVKFAIRLLLLLRYDHTLQPSPPISPLNRQKDIPQLCGKENLPADCNSNRSNVEVTFTLKSSKRVMRTLDAAPPLVSRSWKLPKAAECTPHSTSPLQLTGKYLAGEILHISRPLAHLASMGTFGKFSWKPWFIAFGLDLLSLHLMRQRQDYSKSERFELNRRLFCLFVYVLRSPFYDQYSKKQIINILSSFADNVIGSGLILRPLMEYLPEWQSTYFYVWS